MADHFARRVRYLRVSVTDRCHFRCAYCGPIQGQARAAKADVLTFDEIIALIEVMAAGGVERVRLTGGEPLLRRGIVELVGRVRAVPGIQEVVMTTNGDRLTEMAADLRAAGLGALNVSVDSFDPERFARLTGGGDLSRVLRGIEAAQAAGFPAIKINAVAIRGENDHEVADQAVHCWTRGLVPRFIELMPVGSPDIARRDRVLPTAEIRERLARRFPLEPAPPPGGRLPRGPAAYHRVTSGPFAGLEVGLISPLSDAGFCSTCNRARLTARGEFRPCLGNDDSVSLRDPLRTGGTAAELDALVRAALLGKLPAHLMHDAALTPRRGMLTLGG